MICTVYGTFSFSAFPSDYDNFFGKQMLSYKQTTERTDKMQAVIEAEEKALTVFLSGEIDHHSAVEIRSDIDLAIERYKPERLILDFGEVTFMDSSGIGLVMGRCKIMKLIDGTVEIANASTAIKKVMRLSGLEMIVKI